MFVKTGIRLFTCMFIYCFLIFSSVSSSVFASILNATPTAMPKFATISMVSTFADTPELRYFNSPQAIGTLGFEISDDPKKIFSRYSKPYEFVPPDENYSYYFTTMYGAEENGVELVNSLYQWRKEGARVIAEVYPDFAGSIADLNLWMDNFVSFPDDDFDATEYKERAADRVAEIYKTRLGISVPIAGLKLNNVSQIDASFNYEGEEINLNCRIVEFDIERTETGYKQIRYLVDTSGEEDKVLWLFVKCEARAVK